VNLANASRSQLSRIPGLNRAIDFLIARANVVFGAQHDNETGAHTDITADSITVTGDAEIGGDGTFGGDVIAEFGSGTEVGLGVLTSVDGTTLMSGLPLRHGVLIGGVADGYFLVKRTKSAAFAGGGTYSWALYDLAASTSNPMLMMALDAGVYALIDGGSGATTVRVGSGTRPMLEFYSTNGYYERGRTAATLGAWIDFTPTRTASAGTWTVGTVSTASYTLVGTTMTVAFNIIGTSVSNANVALRIAIPGGFTAVKAMSNPISVNNAGAGWVKGEARVQTSGTVIDLTIAFADTFGIAVTSTSVVGQLSFEVV
jgi:hypothetical protein